MAFADRFDDDLRFYYAVGGFVVLVYVVSVVAVSWLFPGSVDARTLVPLTVGFVAFVFVYAISILVQRLVTIEET